tara:strand:+ start:1568 stop:2536 length:969 start_codon:yes stop_codon:yes gene_type:complete
MYFRSKNILITGGAGFIGSNFVKFYLKKYENSKIIVVDNLTYASNLEFLSDEIKSNKIKFIHGDICNNILITDAFEKYNIDGVINFAAETHVDNSILNPEIFIKTNINGVFNLLNICYKFWMEKPFKKKKKFLNSRFHQISTDEVYGSIESGSFKENSNYFPNSPYSASKAAADLIVRSFNKTYGLNTTISISSNNYGPNQNQEKLIPKALSCIRNNKPIPIYGNGQNIRNWIYVDENCLAIDKIFNDGLDGNSYNVGSDCEMSNLELIKLLYQITEKKEKINFIKDRPGHDFRYSLDCSKLKNELGVSFSENIITNLKKII